MLSDEEITKRVELCLERQSNNDIPQIFVGKTFAVVCEVSEKDCDPTVVLMKNGKAGHSWKIASDGTPTSSDN